MEEMKRALKSRNFIMVALAVSLCLVLSSEFQSIDGVLPAGYHADLLEKALTGRIMTLAIPILAVLPWTTAFVDEVRSGYAKFYLIRSSKRIYLWSKAAAAALMGGGVLAAGAGINYCGYWLVFAPMQAASEQRSAGEIGEQLLRLGLLGAVCALTGMALAIWLMSNYMAYISPFVIYYFLIMLKERYFPGLYYFYPKEWVRPQHYWGESNWGLTAFLAALLGLLFYICIRQMERRLEDV